MQAKHMPILGCKYQSAPDDKAVPPLYACTFCGHLTTTPKVHRFQVCQSRQQHEASKTARSECARE